MTPMQTAVMYMVQRGALRYRLCVSPVVRDGESIEFMDGDCLVKVFRTEAEKQVWQDGLLEQFSAG